MKKTKEEKMFEMLGKLTAMIIFTSSIVALLLYGFMHATTLN